MSIHGVVPPEELIYLHSLQVCKEAVNAESERRDLGSAEALYTCALDLLDILRAQAGKDDAAILDTFISSTRRRLELVGKLAVKFTKAKAAARRVTTERAIGSGNSGVGGNLDSEHSSNVGSYSSGGGGGHAHTPAHEHVQTYLFDRMQPQVRERASSLETRRRQQPNNAGGRDRSISFGGLVQIPFLSHYQGHPP